MTELQAAESQSALTGSEGPPVGITNMVPEAEVPWAQVAEGIEIKLLRAGEGTGTYTMMARFAPGTALPSHRHFGRVHVYTLSGRWGYAEYDWQARAGDYVHEPPGSIHSLRVPSDATEPAVLFMIIDAGMVLMDEHGAMMAVEDADTLRGFYAGALQAAGTAFPDAVLP